MEMGVFQGASVGKRPWDESEPRRLHRDLEVGIAADQAGFDYFWAPEHHCLEEYSHNSSSHLWCLAGGMLTERIRLIYDAIKPGYTVLRDELEVPERHPHRR